MREPALLEERSGAPAPLVTESEERRYAELQLMALDLARHGETATLLSMIQAGLPVNLQDHKGNTLLMLATYHGHLETTNMLLRSHAEVDRRNHRQQTPLGGAAFKGDIAIVESLLAAGADIEADNGNGMTPLMFAVMFGRTDVERLLRAHGANSRARNRWGLRAGWLRILSPFLTRLLLHVRRRPA